MELTVGKADLQKELQLCQGVVEKRSTIPILSNVLLKAADARLQIAATDLDVTILSSCAAKITTPGGVTIEAKRLFDIVRSLPDEDVRVAMQENNQMLIESGTAKFRLLGLPAEDYPTLPTVTATESYTIPLDELKTMVAKVKFAIALEEILRLEPGEEGTVNFGVSENHLFFDAGDRRLLARMIDVNFPNYMEVISRDNDRKVMVDRERLLSTIRRISLVANERTRAVRFDFAPGKLTVSSTNPELGDARETVPIDYAGNPFFVGLNAAYLTDFLSAVDTPSVALDLKDENSQCIGRPSANEELPYDYLYVVMPMRLA